MNPILNWVMTYGYAAIAGLLALGIVGLPVPDETLLIFSGYLVYTGRLHLGSLLLAACTGSITGISLSYLIGRYAGQRLVHSRIPAEKLQRVHNWFHRLGHWTLFAGYYIPGVRHFTALVAGTSALEYRYFALYAYSGAAVWVATFTLLGYRFGENWQAAITLANHHLKLALVLVCAVLAAYLGIGYYLRKRRT